MKRTHLAELHEESGARMVDFSGWYLPVQYTGILAEHSAVRTACGIFDTCHMGRLLFLGDNAADFISTVTTVDAHAMTDGRCRYGLMLSEAGGVLDDLIVYRFSKNKFMVVVNSATHERDVAHLNQQLREGVTIEDIGPHTAKMDIQGPASPKVVSKVLETEISDLKYFRFAEATYDGEPATLSRTGYTGEMGFEIYLPSHKAVSFWDSAVKNGALPCGLGARDTLRLEAGLPLYGHEMTEETTPIQAGMMKYVDLSRDFTGAAALRDKVHAQPPSQLTAFTIEGRQSARHGNRAILGENDIGMVTSGSFAPTLGISVGFAYLNPDLLGKSTAFGIDNGRKILNALVTKAPFYKRH
jgi:aminomethyltransferase